jgi:hypothetical protein
MMNMLPYKADRMELEPRRRVRRSFLSLSSSSQGVEEHITVMKGKETKSGNAPCTRSKALVGATSLVVTTGHPSAENDGFANGCLR